MTRSLFSFVIAAFLMIAVYAYAQPARDPYLDRAGAEWTRLFNAEKFDSLMTLYAADAVAYPPNAPTLSGKAAIQADFDQFRAAYAAHKDFYLDEILTGDRWAVERSHCVVTLIPKAGGAPITENARWIVCRKKIDGRWLITWEIWNADAPAR